MSSLGHLRMAPASVLGAGILLSLLPFSGAPAFYVSFLYLIVFWVSLATSWGILSGYSGYFSFGHAAFFGTGMYTSTILTTEFGFSYLASLPVAAFVASLLGSTIGAVVFRMTQLRGELFSLLTLAVTFVLATVILNTPIDGGAGVFVGNVTAPNITGSVTDTIYLIGLAIAVGTLLIAEWIGQARFGMGLYAINDDEDVAEVKGVPTFRYKLVALAISSGIAGLVGGAHTIYVGFITVGETFSITVPLYVVLMSLLGGARHWLGPAVGATIITVSLFVFASGEYAVLGRAAVALALIIAILFLPDGILLAARDRWRSRRAVRSERSARLVKLQPAKALPVGHSRSEGGTSAASAHPLLEVKGVSKSFGGVAALRGVTLDVRKGEILGLVGPNGSGKTTLINVITGHFQLTSGEIVLDGHRVDGRPAHQVASLGIARTYQIPRPFINLCVLDNVAMAAMFGPKQLQREAAEREAYRWLEFTGLDAKADAKPLELNLHERKFLEFARALAARPRLLLLDEVLSGLNPAEIDSALNLVRAIRNNGTTIVFVEHVMRAVVELSDRIAVLNEGCLFAIGSPTDVMKDPRVVSVYLGKEYAA